jgi:hypothetical protein
LDEENVALRDQLQKLRMDFENSESVQHDFVKLSQALQVCCKICNRFDLDECLS